MLELVEEIAAIRELLGRAESWSELGYLMAMDDEALAAEVQRSREGATAVENRLLFFALEWAATDDAHADDLLADPALAGHANYLATVRAMRPYQLAEGEEAVLARKRVTGATAWAQLFNDLLNGVQPTIGGSEVTFEAAISSLYHPDRTVRSEAATAITAALQPGLRTRAQILNTLLADKAVDDELRGFPTWVSSRNLENQASDDSVQALVDAVVGRYDLPQRWYALKARILGYPLAYYDRMASVLQVRPGEERVYSFTESRDLVLDTYRAFSPQLADVAGQFFDRGWIDAGTRPGKTHGAFCAYTVPSHHPYVMLNWTGEQGDVLVMAHELGHGVHGALAQQQSVLSQFTPLTLAETASVFGEQLTFDALMAQSTTPNERLNLLASSIEGAILTVFRQVAMNRFEEAIHTERRDVGALSVDRFGELWLATQADMFGDSVELSDDYASWWSYITHFTNAPGYVYAYAYGQLLAMSVFQRSRQQGSDFTSRYLHMLSAGGSLPPHELGMIVGCDLADPNFWDAGLALIDAQIDAAESAAAEAGRI